MQRVVVDTIDMRPAADADKKWIIQMKDIYTGFVWAEAVSDRRSVSATRFVESVFRISGEPEVIESSCAMEFIGKPFKNMLKRYPNLEHTECTRRTKLLIQEANKTLKHKIDELMAQNETLRSWTQVLELAVAEINDAIRSDLLENGEKAVQNNEEEPYCPSAVVTCVISDGDNDVKDYKPWSSSPVLLFLTDRCDPVAIGVRRPEITEVHGIRTSTELHCCEVLKVLQRIPNEHDPFEEEIRSGSFVLWSKTQMTQDIRLIIEEMREKRKLNTKKTFSKRNGTFWVLEPCGAPKMAIGGASGYRSESIIHVLYWVLP